MSGAFFSPRFLVLLLQRAAVPQRNHGKIKRAVAEARFYLRNTGVVYYTVIYGLPKTHCKDPHEPIRIS